MMPDPGSASERCADTTEKQIETEPPKDPLSEIENYNRELCEKIEVGFRRPLFTKNPDTSIYDIPPSLRNVKPNRYRVRSTKLSVGWNFDKIYPEEFLHNLHISSHVHSILKRNPDRSFADFLLAMNAMKERIRVSHLVRITVDFKRLSALVMSCCLILDCLLLYYDGKLVPHVDEVCSAGLQDLWIDMLLVDNQVPFFALQKLYDMVIGPDSRYPCLVELCLHFFAQFLPFNYGETPLMESEAVLHLLHLVHTHLLLPTSSPHEPPGSLTRLFNKIKILFNMIKILFNKIKSTVIRSRSPPPPQLPLTREPPGALTRLFNNIKILFNKIKRTVIGSRQPPSPKLEPIPCARRLQKAGINFRKKHSSGFSNITFHGSTLEIPYLRIDNNTETLLRTLVAWEQRHLDTGAYFTSYAFFMDYIINTAEDVQILNDQGIIEQTLGSEEQVASIFNGLNTNVVFIGDENDFLPHLCRDLNKFCRNRFNIWWGKLLTDYFSNPWTILSVIAAIVLLVLTGVQTFFSAFAYFRPPK